MRPKEITIAELKKHLKNPQEVTLLDVREKDEYDEDHIEGVQLIPLGHLQTKLDKIPKDKPVMCICRSGSRSMYATMMLSQAGFDAYNVTGGMMAYRYD